MLYFPNDPNIHAAFPLRYRFIVGKTRFTVDKRGSPLTKGKESIAKGQIAFPTGRHG
ncbi:hypothetical protein RMSM_04906 [Rhodopirellula maiorica SM1]|uniref:Uncharacterized protein n=1 Tax=Rhodopirellula maiorica SM1 TaxID=1265738 RepID=M5RG90_9BACT|nr:hypothetical protein RMSM_04906 [Rhodopirellula maiorica SM1]